MSSPASFEVLLAASRELDDDFIDEDISEIQQGSGSSSRTVSNRMITVRGKRHGAPVVLSYQDYYSASFSATSIPIHELNVLEVFVAQPKISFEGTCRRRGFFDKVGRWFGAGGAKGPHPIFSRLRLDATEPGSGSIFQHDGFSAALEELVLSPDAKRVLLQAGSGLSVVLTWRAEGSSSEYVLGLVDQVRAVNATLD